MHNFIHVLKSTVDNVYSVSYLYLNISDLLRIKELKGQIYYMTLGRSSQKVSWNFIVSSDLYNTVDKFIYPIFFL